MTLRKRLDRLEAASARGVAHGPQAALAAAMPAIIRGARPLPISLALMPPQAEGTAAGHFLSSP